MSEKFVVTGGLSIPQGQELEIGANTLSSILTGDTLSFAEDAKKNVIPSEYSVAKYIDTQLGASNQLNFATDSDGEFDTEILLASETLSILGTIGEIETSVSADNSIKIGLPDNVTVAGTTSIGGTLTVTGTSTLSGAVNLAAAGVATDIKGTLSVDEVATFDVQSVHTGGIDCNGKLSMGTNSIEGTADEMIISADGSETSASGNEPGSLSLNASGGIFTDAAVDMDSSLDVAGVTSLAATNVLTSVRGTMNVAEAASFDATATFDVESVHSAGLAMTNSSKKDFSVAMDGSDVEVADLTGFESGKIVLKVKNSAGDITSKEILAINGSYVEYATVSSGTEVSMTVDVDGDSVTVNSANGTATGSVDLIK